MTCGKEEELSSCPSVFVSFISLCLWVPAYFYLFIYILIDLERRGENPSICSTYAFIHRLILTCALTED